MQYTDPQRSMSKLRIVLPSELEISVQVFGFLAALCREDLPYAHAKPKSGPSLISKWKYDTRPLSSNTSQNSSQRSTLIFSTA